MGNITNIKDLEGITTLGRPRKYTAEQFLKKANEYFIECDTAGAWTKQDFIKSGPNAGKIINTDLITMYTIEGVCLHCAVHESFIRQTEQYLKPEESEEDMNFYLVCKYIRGRIRKQRLEGGGNMSLNALIVARLEGLSDKQEIKATNTNISVNVQDQGLADKLDQE